MRCQTCRRRPSSVCSNHLVNFFLCTAMTCLARDRGDSRKTVSAAPRHALVGERLASDLRHGGDSPDLAWTGATANRSCIMSDTVWISIAMGHGTNIRRLWDSFAETDQRNNSIAWGQQNDAGEPLKAECFPSEIYGA